MRIKFWNILKSIESFMQNSATAARTWTFPDKNGTVAMIDDVVAASLSEISKLRQYIGLTSHGFAVGDALTIVGGALTKISDPSTQKFVGLVISVGDANNFVMAMGGWVDTLNLSTGVYYAQTDGTIALTPATDMPVFFSMSPLWGYILSSGSGSTSAWSDTAPGTVERSITSEAQNIVTRAAAGSSDSSNSDARTPSEKGLVEMLLSFLSTAWTWASKQTFTTAIRLTSTTHSEFLRVDSDKDVVSVPAASQSDMITATDNVNPATALSVESKRSVKRASASVSSGTMTLNAGSKEEIKFEATTAISSSFAMAFSNWANAEIINATLPITGSVAITMTDGTGGTPNIIMEASDGRYVSKVLTLVGTTASPFELSFNRISSDRFLLRVSDRYPAS